MQKINISISDVEGKPAVCFETGLDPRSFARTKMSQSLIETGFVVYPDGTHEIWRPSGVNESGGFMRVWGPHFSGKRLDLLVNGADSLARESSSHADPQQLSLQAVVYWIRAKMFLGETQSALNPGAVFVCCGEEKKSSHPMGSVFFSPEHLSSRCLYIEGSEIDRYNCPDLLGMDAAAFCAGLMLYKILSGAHPYPTADIYQDMREGIFLPVNLAVPGLDEKLIGLINSSLLLPVQKKKPSKSGTNILTDLLEMLMGKDGTVVPVSSLIQTVSTEKESHIGKERKRYLFKQNAVVKTRRFFIHNKYVLLGVTAGVAFALFIVFNMTGSFSSRPTTEGMAADSVVTAYYDAFSSLDHIFMEACIQGADRSDIQTAATFFAVYKTRQAYEFSSGSSIVPARLWKELGGELPAPNVFGVTDLSLEHIGGGEYENMIVYSADYLLWAPDTEYAIIRSDILTLRRDRRKHWRIIEILRTES